MRGSVTSSHPSALPDAKLHRSLLSVFPAMCPVVADLYGGGGALNFVPWEFMMRHAQYAAAQGVRGRGGGVFRSLERRSSSFRCGNVEVKDAKDGCVHEEGTHTKHAEKHRRGNRLNPCELDHGPSKLVGPLVRTQQVNSNLLPALRGEVPLCCGLQLLSLF